MIPGDGEVIEGIASGRRVGHHRRVGARSSASRAATARRSPAAPGCCPTRSSCASPPSPGETFLDRMIALVEGASRQKTPNEIALNILLAGLTLIFLLATVTLQPFAIYSGAEQTIIVLVALLVCLIPTTIGALLSAIGIAGMDRLVQRNVLAMSRPGRRGGRRLLDAAARQDRHDHARQPPGGRVPPRRRASTERELADAAQLSSLADETPEGRSIVVLAKERFGLRERDLDGRHARAVHRPDPHERRRHRRAGQRPQGRGRLGDALGRRAGRHRPARARRRSSTRHRRPAAARPLAVADGTPGARRDPPQGRREAGHARALRRAAGAWASAR